MENRLHVKQVVVSELKELTDELRKILGQGYRVDHFHTYLHGEEQVGVWLHLSLSGRSQTGRPKPVSDIEVSLVPFEEGLEQAQCRITRDGETVLRRIPAPMPDGEQALVIQLTEQSAFSEGLLD